jgi:peptidoglycan/xylan/chitin deacetylase (PgdA/CDA1 family)
MIPTLIRFATIRIRLGLTRPLRRRAIAKMASTGCAPMSALFYHRVADTHPNDWTIGCKGFQRHVDYCRKNFDLVSLSELQTRCVTARSYRPAVSFTFDDGYAENCDFAIPLLLEHKIPCTYFVSLQHVLTGQAFDHDLKAGLPLRINTVREIRDMADAGIEIGLHSRTHIDFDQVTCRKILKREIIDAKSQLADLIGRPIRYFAFPFGLPNQLTPQAIAMVHEAGMLGFCSAYGAYNLVGQDPFHIRRIHGDCSFERLENWLTFDKRKLLNQPTIEYVLSERPTERTWPFPITAVRSEPLQAAGNQPTSEAI